MVCGRVVGGLRSYIAVQPASTANAVPVTNVDSSDARTEFTLSPGVMILLVVGILAALIAAGVLPADVFARVVEKAMAR